MDSPLTRQVRPDAFEPKVVELYRYLFHILSNDEHEDTVPSEGFWRELFLLKPDQQKLFDILDPLTADNLLHIQTHTRLFFRRAIEEAGSGISPRNENALENLTGFLSAVLNKRYMNPSTDVIEILAGLDSIDKLVSEFVQGLEAIIKQSSNLAFRRKAVKTTLAMVSGSYQTSLVTYFIHRDMFPALVKYAHEASEPTPETLVLLGLLANYNKFESQNLYQNRLEDFVNQDTIHILVNGFANVCKHVRDQYVDVLDDAPVPWTLTSTLQMVGLRALTPEAKKPVPPTEDEAKVFFNALPSAEAAAILSAYTFVHANKIFTSRLVATTLLKDSTESPLSRFLSTTSYLCHHAHRGNRGLHYAVLLLLTIRLFIEDPVTIKHLTSTEAKTVFRLARQRAPHLPHITNARIPATAILDICNDTLSHNLRKRLSVPLYRLALTNLHALITYLDSTKTRLQHHWSYVWGSLFSLLRFLTQYAADMIAVPSHATQIRSDICTPLTSVLAFCLSRGDNFLPDPSSYDDLFYKLVEVASILPKFKAAYCPRGTTTSSSIPSSPPDTLLLATNALLSVVSHYQSLLSATTTKAKAHQSPATIQKVIKEGYETLPEIGSPDPSGTAATQRIFDFGYRGQWREITWKAEIKKMIRTAVEDGRDVALKA